MQKEFIGKDSFKKIKYIVDALNAKRILLVTGKKSFSLSGAKHKIKKILKDLEVIIFDDFQSNPRLEDAESGINLVRQNNPDLIISIGGGSVLDMAKLINILSAQNDIDFFDIIKNPNLINNKGTPLVAIPTTAGSGSQATHFSVVYIDKVKYSLSHSYILPNYAIVDPALSYNVPSNVAASCAMDSLSQAVESYWSVGSTKESRRYSAKAIKMILPALKKSIVNNDNDAKDIMAYAAHMSGKAINISKTTAAHALSYSMTALFGIPHGHAVALTLGKFFGINDNADKCNILDQRGGVYLNATMKELFNMFDCDTADCCHDKWYELMKLLDLEVNIVNLGIKNIEDIKHIVNNVNIERIKNNPVLLDKKELFKIFDSIKV